MTRQPFLRPFAALLGLGLLGAFALPLVLVPAMERLPPEARGGLSVELVTALALIQPTALLLIAVATGVKLAGRVGFRSHIAAWAAGDPAAGAGLRRDLFAGLIGGACTALLIVALEAVLLDAGPAHLPTLQLRTPEELLAAVLYGGLTEELVMRYGGMSFVAWLLWRLSGRRGERPGAGTIGTALAVSALLFGAAHLGAAALSGPLTPFEVGRVVGLNALAGLAFGGLYWRYSLESAMVAHAFFHVTLAALAQLAVTVGPP